jgi:hypothetical protein
MTNDTVLNIEDIKELSHPYDDVTLLKIDNALHDFFYLQNQ